MEKLTVWAAVHGTALLVPPKPRIIAEAELEFYRRKQNTVTVRHVSGDRIVAVVKIVSTRQQVHLECGRANRQEGGRVP